jgi:hypothetical protein
MDIEALFLYFTQTKLEHFLAGIFRTTACSVCKERMHIDLILSTEVKVKIQQLDYLNLDVVKEVGTSLPADKGRWFLRMIVSVVCFDADDFLVLLLLLALLLVGCEMTVFAILLYNSNGKVIPIQVRCGPEGG